MPYIGLGAYTTKQPDPFSFTSNQAALATIKAPGAGVYGERRFMLAENSVYAMAVSIPTKMGNFGLQVNYAGFKNFNENKLGIAYARSLGSNADIGIQFNYYGYRIPGYGSASSVNFETGFIIHFSEKLNGGFHIYNPVGGNLGEAYDEKLASVYKMGLGYDASENFYVGAEIIKVEDLPVNVCVGIQYQFLQQFFARAGIKSETGSGFAGFGLAWKNLRIDIASSYHPHLGFSPGLMLIINLKDKRQ